MVGSARNADGVLPAPTAPTDLATVIAILLGEQFPPYSRRLTRIVADTRQSFTGLTPVATRLLNGRLPG